MSEYIRSIGLYIAMFVMVFTIVAFSIYFSRISSLKQDTYKEFMYTAVNQSTARLQGYEGLYEGGDFNAYYMCHSGDEEDDLNGRGPKTQCSSNYQLLDYEIVKHISLAAKTSDKVKYEFIYNRIENTYFLHLVIDDVSTVLKFELAEGEGRA